MDVEDGMPNFDCDGCSSNNSLNLDAEHNDDDLTSGNGEDADVGIMRTCTHIIPSCMARIIVIVAR